MSGPEVTTAVSSGPVLRCRAVRLGPSSRWLAALLAVCACPRPAPPASAAPRAHYPAVPFGGGPVLAEAELVSVTLGGDAPAGHDAFTRWLAESGWLTERVAEYGVRRVTYGGAVALDSPPEQLTDEGLRRALATVEVAAGKLYVVWLPTGATLIDRNGDRTCFSNPGTGYHDTLEPRGAAYVAVPACPPRFSAVLDRAGSMHLDAARLVVNALTNPSPRGARAFALVEPANGWSGLGAEVGDFCWGRFVERDGRRLQRVWSNAAAERGEEPCTPAPAAAAFGLTVEPRGRLLVGIGEPVVLTVRGWSNQPRADWPIEVRPWAGDFSMQASLDRATLNDGQTARLSLVVPHPMPPGTEGTVLLRALADDDTPLWPVSFVIR